MNLASIGKYIAGVRSSLSFKPLTYGYANARVKAMRSAFVPKQTLRDMLAANTVGEALGMLERTDYKGHISTLSLNYRGEELVDVALGASFSTFAQKLQKITPKEGRGTMAALLARWDVRNLKAVMHGRRLGRKFSDIAPLLVPAGGISAESLRQMFEAQDTHAFYGMLRSSAFGRKMLENPTGSGAQLAQIKHFMLAKSGEESIAGIEHILDAYYYSMAEAAVVPSDMETRAIAKMVQAEADAKNLSTVLRLKAAGMETAKMKNYIVSGSSLKIREWLELANMGSGAAIVAKVARRFSLAGEAEQFAKDGQISSIEVAMEQRTAQYSVRAMHRLQMSLGVLVGALILKEQEMANIRKIVKGKSLGLPRERIEKMLVMVD